MKDWQKLIPPAEFEAYQRSGFHGDLAMGQRAALIVVDVTFGFTGSRGLTLAEAVAEFSAACGPSSWTAMPNIARLIEMFRARGLPIVYSRSRLADIGWTGKATKAKINWGKVEAPTLVKGALWTATAADNTINLLSGTLIEDINDFIDKKCDEVKDEWSKE